jgi:hypothetical protein
MVYPHIEYQGPAYGPNPASPRELDSRTSDGIHVRLLWHPADGHVSVAVHDSKTGEELELTVGADQNAREVYLHPYAYAASSGPAADVARGVGAAVMRL